MAEYITNGQSNYGWSLTWDAAGRYPIVAKRRFATLADAQAFVDDISATATATEGLIIAVFKDSVAKNNGVYYIESVAMAEGETGKLVKVGGTETEVAADYAAAVELSKTLTVGQLIKVEGEYTENEGAEDEVTYQKGFYIVEAQGVISALSTSTGSDDEMGALKGRVTSLETTVGNDEAGIVKDVADLKQAVEEIEIPEVPVQDVTVGGVSVLNKETGVAEIVMPDVTVYETIENVNKVREDVSGNTEAIESLAGVVGKAADGENEATGLVKAVADNAAAIETKVDKVEGSRLMTDAEGTKLESIAEGAQVNKIEVVKVNGTALTIADADKSVDVIVPTAPVQGVADGEKVISLDGNKLKSTLTLAYVPADGEQNAVLRLQGINGEVVSSIDATAFVKDGMLEGAKLEGPKEDESGEKYLVLTFNTAAGKEDIRMDVTDLLDYYAAGDGLVLDGKTFKVKVDETANAYLQVTTNGIAVSQAFLDKINELDNAVLAAAKAYADGLAVKYDAAGAAATALADAKTYADGKASAAQVAAEKTATDLNAAMNTRVEALEAIDHEHENKTVLDGITADKVTAWDAAEQNAKTYADNNFVKTEGYVAYSEDEKTKLAGIAEGAQVNVIEAVKVNGVDATVADKVAEVTVTGADVALGADITSEEEVVYGKDTKLSSVLQGIQDSISVAVSGGLTGVVGGNGIDVSAVAANKQTISAKISAAEGNLISVDENGLYAAMYYDGDDVE